MTEHPAAASAGSAGIARHADPPAPTRSCLLVPVIAAHPKVVVRHPTQTPRVTETEAKP